MLHGLLDVINDPPMRYGFIVICSDSDVKNLYVDFLLFHVVLDNMVAIFHFAFDLVGKNA